MDQISNGNLPNTTTIHKNEEMPYEGKPVDMSEFGPQTDKQGMKIMDSTGAGATGRDING